MKTLDFIIIGAQKSATTSLYKYLSAHPSIEMPIAKEAPFYSDVALYGDGWDKFARKEFPAASQESLWGTATPQYMSDSQAPARIRRHVPAVKLIAVLRNPIDRAYSHYGMAVRRGIEQRRFSDVVEDLTNPARARNSRRLALPDQSNGYHADDRETSLYLCWSEYGRILKRYMRIFPEHQLKIVFMDDLERNPAAFVSEILDFLGVADVIVPDNVGKVYHRGGKKRLVPDWVKNCLKHIPLMRSLWRLLPLRLRGAIDYWYEQANVRKVRDDGIDSISRLKLISFFKGDVEALSKQLGRPAPWPEFS